ncbi:hypothetical protein AN958_10902 [Leucoagaricus sp. SymC.cos]|nr:hypothetical protein AN958_10902 [Leucoagaricus sp. SymC.cos]
MNFPLDTWFEIFAYLAPYDLLKLARTTKRFREILTSLPSRFAWVRALENVPGLPPCPTDMTEPAYANLAFSPYCHSCNRYTERVEWELRVRFCPRCSKLEIGLIKYRFWRDEGDPILELIPTRIDWSGKRNSESDVRYEFPVLSGTDAEFSQHAKLCRTWAATLGDKRANELKALKGERYDIIVKNLTELGWGEELAKLQSPLSTHKLVKKAQKLTPRRGSSNSDGHPYDPVCEMPPLVKETKIIDYRDTIGHECLTQESRFRFKEPPLPLWMENPLQEEEIIRYKHSFSNIVLDEAYGRAIADIARAAGLDPGIV